MDYYFKAEKMSVGYDKQPLIEDIDIGLRKGEILTLIGPNGAGKSTILRSIAKQLSFIAGTVYINDENIKKMSGSELSQKMAVVFTDKLRTEMMTCEDVVATGRYPYTGRFGILSKADLDVVKEAMDLVQVTSLKDKDFTCISDGQRQRVMLARAICQEPEIIILDEPTSFLDVKYKLEFLSILQQMRRQKKLTVIMSLHELDLAQRISDKVLCAKGKYIERFGTPEEVFEKGYLTNLFDISVGSMDEESGCVELVPAQGDAKTFVIAGGGSGRNVYRKLQRLGIPFVTGILYQNDLDYPVAKALSKEVIEGISFEPISDEVLDIAKKRLKSCEKVICCREHFGTFEHANRELLEYAKQCEILIEMKQR